jgi:hypothetical protein
MGKGQINFVDWNRPMRGIFEYKLYRHVNGKKILIQTFGDHNIIVNRAREQMTHLVSGDGVEDRKISKIAFGTNGIEENLLDVSITGAYIKNLDGYTFPEQTKVRFSWSLGVGEANGKAIREFGLICADNSLFARRTRILPINKDSDFSMEGSWTIVY